VRPERLFSQGAVVRNVDWFGFGTLETSTGLFAIIGNGNTGVR